MELENYEVPSLSTLQLVQALATGLAALSLGVLYLAWQSLDAWMIVCLVCVLLGCLRASYWSVDRYRDLDSRSLGMTIATLFWLACKPLLWVFYISLAIVGLLAGNGWPRWYGPSDAERRSMFEILRQNRD